MLEFWRSLFRQSNPSTLTVAGLSPMFILAHPALRADDDGDGKPEGGGTCNEDKGLSFSSPKRASWIKGLAALLGGDPQKKGGEDAACDAVWSTPWPSYNVQNKHIQIRPAPFNVSYHERIWQNNPTYHKYGTQINKSNRLIISKQLSIYSNQFLHG